MRSMTVLYGIFLAAVFAVSAPVVMAVLQCVFAPWFAFRLFLSGAVIGYAALTVPRSARRSGRIFAIAAITVFQAALFFAIAPLWAFVVGSAGVLWLTRALLFGRSLLHIVTEAVLVGAALLCALFAAKGTGSLALAIWSFLLVLAAGSLTAKPFERRKGIPRPSSSAEPRFERAYRTAEQAIAALARE